MAKKGVRQEIPRELAARVLFLADRTCCVCRIRGKPVQIHHIDDNPNNNSLSNLAVLCFDCHRNTQIQGGFDRKLDADQVILYRNDWNRIVAQTRAKYEASRDTTDYQGSHQIELMTSIAEIYRENEEFELLAMHYHTIGNNELRDKYIEIALQKKPKDQTTCFLRCLQGKPDLIPRDVIAREVERYAKNRDWLQRARFYADLGKHREAVLDYTRGIGESLKQNELFTAAYYLKELAKSELIQELLISALRQAQEAGDLWWQVRALEELGWKKELNDLVLQNSKEIEESGDPMLSLLLANARGDKEESAKLLKDMASGTHLMIMGDNESNEDA